MKKLIPSLLLLLMVTLGFTQEITIPDPKVILQERVNQLKDMVDLTANQTRDVIDIFTKTQRKEEEILAQKRRVEQEESILEQTREAQIEKILTPGQKENFKKTKGMPGLLGAHDAREFGWSHKKDKKKDNNKNKRLLTQELKMSHQQRAEFARYILDENLSVDEALDNVLNRDQKNTLAALNKKTKEPKKSPANKKTKPAGKKNQNAGKAKGKK